MTTNRKIAQIPPFSPKNLSIVRPGLTVYLEPFTYPTHGGVPSVMTPQLVEVYGIRYGRNLSVDVELLCLSISVQVLRAEVCRV